MGVASQSVSISRYRILGLATLPKIKTVNEALADFKGKSIRLEGVHKEDVVAWVRPEGLDNVAASERDHWDGSDCEALDGYVLRMRHERRRVPASLLTAVFQQKLTQLKKQGEKISKRERDEVRRNIKMELLGQALPTLGYVDGFWDLQASELYIYTTTKAKRQHFETLFTKSFLEAFGAVLLPVQPPLLGLSDEAWDPDLASQGSVSMLLERLSQTIPSSVSEYSSTLV